MELRPIRLGQAAERALALPVAVFVAALTFPVWGPIVVLLYVEEWWRKTFDPPRWRKVFALWPVECDPWPDDGYAGWVWLETVWRNPAAPGWTKYRREPPQ